MSLFDQIMSGVLGGPSSPSNTGMSAPGGQLSTAQKILGPLFGVTFQPRVPPVPGPGGGDPNQPFIGPMPGTGPNSDPGTAAQANSANLLSSIAGGGNSNGGGGNLASILSMIGGL